MVGIYSTGGTLLREIALNVPLPDPCAYPSPIIRIGLSSNQLVVLRLDIPQAGSLKATVEVYDWTTGALEHTWPSHSAMWHRLQTGSRYPGGSQSSRALSSCACSTWQRAR